MSGTFLYLPRAHKYVKAIKATLPSSPILIPTLPQTKLHIADRGEPEERVGCKPRACGWPRHACLRDGVPSHGNLASQCRASIYIGGGFQSTMCVTLQAATTQGEG